MMSRSTTYLLISAGIFFTLALFFFSLTPSFTTGATMAAIPNPCVGQVNTPPGCTGTGADLDATIAACDTNCKTVCKAHEDIACSRAQCPTPQCTCARQSAISCTIVDDSCLRYDENGDIIGSIPGKTCRANGIGSCKATCAGTTVTPVPPRRGE